MLTKNLIGLLVALLVWVGLSACPNETVRIEGQHTPAAESFSYAYWIDSADSPIQQSINADKHGRFTVYKGGFTFYLGYLSKTCWVRVRVQNSDTLPVLLFWNTFCDIDTLSLFEVSDSGIVLKEHPFISFQIPIEQREIKARSLSFGINLEAHQAKILYLRVVNKGDILQMPMSISTNNEYYQRELRFYLLYGVFFGIFIFAVFVNLMLWIFMHDSRYLWYGGYVLLVMLFLSMEVYLEGNLLPYWLFKVVNAAGRLVIIFLMFGMQAGMALRIMGLTAQNSRFYKVMRSSAKILFGCALVTLPVNLFRYQIPIPVQTVLFSVAILVAGFAFAMYFVTLVEQIIKKNRLAIYYAASCLLLFICMVNYYLQLFNWSVPFLFQHNGLGFGLTMEVLALAALIAYSFNLLNQEKINLEKENALKQEHLAGAVIHACQEEQANIGRNLHDGALSHLMALRMLVNQKLHQVEELTDVHETAKTLSEIESRLDKSIRDVREVSHHLIPQEFEANTLTEIIESDLQIIENTSTMRFDLRTDEKINALPKDIQLHLYRIASELINNILRHSQASEVSIQFISVDNKIQLMVEDDGIGMNVNSETKGIGLKNISMRVQLLKGKLTIDSGRKGTVIIIEIPDYAGA